MKGTEFIDLQYRLEALERNQAGGCLSAFLFLIVSLWIFWLVNRYMLTSECNPTLTHTQILHLQRQQWNQEGFLSRPFDNRCWSPEKGYYEMPEEK